MIAAHLAPAPAMELVRPGPTPAAGPASAASAAPVPAAPAAANEPVAPAQAPLRASAAGSSGTRTVEDGKPLYQRARAPEWLIRSVAMVLGLAIFVALWSILAKAGGQLPNPTTTLHSAIELF